MPNINYDIAVIYCIDRLRSLGGKTTPSELVESFQRAFKASHCEAVDTMRKLMEHGDIKVEYKGNIPFVSLGSMKPMTDDELLKLWKDIQKNMVTIEDGDTKIYH